MWGFDSPGQHKENMNVVHCKVSKFDVYIGRPSPWGNPFSHKDGTLAQYKVTSRKEAVAEYERWVKAQPVLVEKIKFMLKGKVLGCWCAPKSCHGDVLVKIANEP